MKKYPISWRRNTFPFLTGCLVVFSACTKNISEFSATYPKTDNATTQFTIMCEPYGIGQAGTTTIPHKRGQMQTASAGDDIGFFNGAGSGVFGGADIYHVSTNTWTTTTFSELSHDGAAAACTTKMASAGGYNGGPTPSDIVNILDVTTNQWSVAHLSVARMILGAAGSGSKILFAGGNDFNGPCSRVDIYDAPTNTWSTAELSVAREYPAGAAAGNIIAFAGGRANNTLLRDVDLYNVQTGEWSHSTIPKGKSGMKGIGGGSQLFFACNSTSDDIANLCYIYDISTKTWSQKNLPHITRGDVVPCLLGSKVIFIDAETGAADTYDLCSKSWGSAQFTPDNFYQIGGAATAGGKLLVSGKKVEIYKPSLFVIN